jgi:hypothetical protein
MRGRILLVWTSLLSAGLASAGCATDGSPASWGVPRPSPHEDATTASSTTEPAAVAATNGGVRVVRLTFEVLRIRLPIDSIQHSRKIWNHVDELRADTALVARLARNGVRAGAVAPGSWPAINTILEACDAEVGKDRWNAQSDLPLTIEVDELDESETLFCYTPDDRLVGKTFHEGKKLMNLDYAVHAEMGGAVDMKLSFEIRHDRGVMAWQRQGGILQQVPATDRHVFADLTTLVTLNPGETLLIGPSPEARNEYLVGGRFLVDEKEGRQVETLYGITPLPYQITDASR